MAAPRLPFLWPMLYRAAESQSPEIRIVRAAARYRAYHATPRRKQQETVGQRYGPANEPPPHLGGGKGLGPSVKQYTEAQPKLPKIGQELQKDGEQEVKHEQAETVEMETADRLEPATVDGATARPPRGDPMLDAADPSKVEEGAPNQYGDKPIKSLLDSVPNPAKAQQTPSKSEELPGHRFDEHSPPIKAPHIEAPRYVHHFDTFGLVKRLEDSGWTNEHAITAMKAVRLNLADNMELAKEALVSKSMIENESCLFKAACAELKTEVTARRQAEQEKMRTERTQLQHEVDILSQRVGQEAGVLKDDLKGMFDDRKMATRNEQRHMEAKIQQLNYKITVELQADARSDVEGLRWVLTRRLIMFLGVMIIMIVGSLKMYSNLMQEREHEAKRRANQRTSGTQTEERKSGYSDAGTGGMGGSEVLVSAGDNPAFVSLG
ncbi:hypothetical protein LTR78_009209 [Recurvomyces mirabilis]|uniref:MOZ protein represents a chromatin-associated acetyltransferase n=1 Tax=Recurvomyces mirabilis TaxID=574656 RepID=A0AAE0TS29_9PEZI|nr:hypothetical protein LTR78_009209 [Recurvomyces mirabilis]KAK5155631.1 hypothetical protein LTS14_005892 [Recurvomyces mirabilis]